MSCGCNSCYNNTGSITPVYANSAVQQIPYGQTCPGGCLRMTTAGYRCSNRLGCGCNSGCGCGCGCGCRCGCGCSSGCGWNNGCGCTGIQPLYAAQVSPVSTVATVAPVGTCACSD